MSICGKLVFVAIHSLPQMICYLWWSLYCYKTFCNEVFVEKF